MEEGTKGFWAQLNYMETSWTTRELIHKVCISQEFLHGEREGCGKKSCGHKGKK